MNNPYLFIVGCPRSGTTLIQRIHPEPDDFVTWEKDRVSTAAYGGK